MMKKNTQRLCWIMPELPSGTDVANLVNAKIISKEEARKMLFAEVKPSTGIPLASNSTGSYKLNYQ